MALSNLTPSQKEDLAVSLAVLLVHDSGKTVDSASIAAVTKAAGLQVQPYWGALFGKFLAGRDLDELLLKPGA
jgi:large subunit ribosomal protein LP1